MADEFSVDITAKTDKLLKALQALPDVGEEQARKMVSAISREFKNAEKASEKAAKAAAKEWEQGLGAVKGSAEKLASVVGGPLGDMADLALDLGEKLHGTAGALGATAATAGVAVAGIAALAVGTRALADAAVAARARLEEQGLAAMLPPGAADSLDAYTLAGERLQQATDLLVVSLGSDLADGLTTVTYAAIGAIGAFDGLTDATGTWGEQALAAAETVSWVSPLRWEIEALRWATEGAAESGRELADGLEAEAQAAYMATQAYSDLGLATDDASADSEHRSRVLGDQREAERLAAEEARRRAQAVRTAAEADREALAAAQEYQRGLVVGAQEFAAIAQEQEDALAREQIAQMRLATAAREDAIAHDDLLASVAAAKVAIEGAQQAVDRASSGWSVAGAQVQAYAEQLDGVVNSEAADALVSGAEDLVALQRDQHDQAVQQLQDRMAMRRKEISTWRSGALEQVDAQLAAGEIDKAQAQAQREAIQEEARTRMAALDRRTAAERAALLKSFKAQKNAQRVLAIIDAARAAVALIPAFSFMTVFAPAGAAAAAAAGLAVQLATIGAQKAPEFPMGLVPSTPDHGRTVRLQPEEGVLTRRGMEGAGAEGLAALNEGRSAAPSRVVVQLGRRTLAEAVVDAQGRVRLDPRTGQHDPWGSR